MCTYGETLQTKWVTIHDTESTVYAAESALGTVAAKCERGREGVPESKRRSSGPRTASSGRPRTSTEFYFDETGDTSALSGDNDPPATAAQAPGVSVPIPPATGKGGWCARCSSWCRLPRGRTRGTINLFYSGDVEPHAGLDNLTFLTERPACGGGGRRRRSAHAAAQRAGLRLFIFDYDASYANPACQPILLACRGGGTSSATIDSGLLDAVPKPANFVMNDGDNETTGIHHVERRPVNPHGHPRRPVPAPVRPQGWSRFWTATARRQRHLRGDSRGGRRVLTGS